MKISKTIVITDPVDIIISRVISPEFVICSGRFFDRFVVFFSGTKTIKKLNEKETLMTC